MKKIMCMLMGILMIMNSVFLTSSVYAADAAPKVTVRFGKNQSSYESGETLKIIVTYSNFADGASKVELFHDGDSVETDSISGEDGEWTSNIKIKEGRIKVKAVVTDKNGKQTSGDATYNAVKGTRTEENPTINDITLSPSSSIEVGDEVTIKATLKDDVKLAEYEVIHNGKIIDQGSLTGTSKKITAEAIAVEGSNKITIRVKDKAGYSAEEVKTFTAKKPQDNKSPTIEKFTLNKEKYNAGDKITIKLKFKDDKGLSRYEIEHGGDVFEDELDGKTETSTITQYVNAKVGTIKVKVTVWDNAGNSTSLEEVYTGAVVVDNPPDAEIVFPSDKTQFEEGKKISVSVKLSDDKGLASYKIYHDNKEIDKGDVKNNDKKHTAKPDPITVTIGKHTIKVEVIDTFDNKKIFTKDYTGVAEVNDPPKAELTFPSNKKQFEVGEKVTLTVKLSDDKGLANCVIYNDNTVIPIDPLENNKKSDTIKPSFTATTIGSHKIKVVVTDTSNKTETYEWDYKCVAEVNDPPAAEISFPSNKTEFDEDASVKVTVNFKDDKGLSRYEIYHNGTRVDDGDFDDVKSKTKYKTVTAVTGKNEIKVVVWDSSNVQTIETKSFTGIMVDNKPVAKISLVGGSKYEEGENVAVKIELTDDVGIAKYRIDHGSTKGNVITASGKTVTKTESFIAVPGNNEIKVTVWDTANNSSSDKVSYSCNRHNDPPKVILSPLSKTTYDEGEEITITAKFEDDYKLSKYRVINGGNNGNNVSFSGTKKADEKTIKLKAVAGNNVEIKVIVVDSDGDESSACLYYTGREVNNPPKISKASLEPSGITLYKVGDKITVKATLEDDKGLSRYVINHNGSQVKSENISGTKYSVSYSNITVLDGSNDITIIVYDTAGNSTNKTLHYKGTDEFGDPPVADITFSPGPYVEGKNVTVYVTFSDDYNLTEYKATQNGKRKSGGELDGTRDSADFKVMAVEGENEIEVTVTDAEGNERSFSKSFTASEDLSNAAPEISSVSGLKSKYYVGEMITMSIDFRDDKGLSEFIIENGSTIAASGTLNGRSYTFPCQLVAKEGNVDITITVIDEDDKKTVVTKKYVGEKDTADPEVSIKNLGTSYNEGDRVTFTATFSDNAALSRFEFYHDGILQNSENFSSNSTEVDRELSFTAGKNSHTIQITVWDKNNNQRSYDMPYTGISKDYESPSVNVSGLNPKYEAGEAVVFAMAFSDNEGLSRYEVLIDNIVVKQSSLSGTTASERYSFAAVEGKHSIVIRVYDQKNNMYEYPTEYTAESDNVKPVIKLDGYKNYFKAGESIVYTATFTDNKMLAHYEIVYNESGEIISSGNLTGTTDVIEVSFVALEGEKITYSIKVWDEKGNLGIDDSLWYAGNADGKRPRPNADEEIVPTGPMIKNSGGVNVSVTIPKFRIYINNDKSNQLTAQYPYIVYNGITYFPMTYHGARFLGLKTDWTHETGLKVAMNSVASEGQNEKTLASVRNEEEYYTATTVSGYINVMGKYIDNDNEQYPLIIFREVTYFPLTWRFCVDEFGWNYTYTEAGGLEINSI